MAAVVLRSQVEPGLHYSKYRDSLRYDFWFSCAYCGITEVEAATISFETDHFFPHSRGGTDEYGNLMWCCHACNSKKSNIWPTDGLAAAGYRYVRPDQDDPNDHYKLGDNGSVLIEPLTPAGKWTHNIIDLNRGALREVRAARQALFESAEAIAHGLGRLSASKRGMDQLKPEVRAKYLRAIEQAKGQWKTLEAAMDDASFGDFIRQMNKSSNIQDPDEQREHTKRRREFLKEIKALHPDYPD